MSRKYIEVALEQLIKATEDANKVIKELQNAISESCKEPKVFTAEEIVNNYGGPCGRTGKCDFNDALRIAKESIERGRLERNNEFRPVIQIINGVIARIEGYSSKEREFLKSLKNSLSESIKNLPPLNRDET